MDRARQRASRQGLRGGRASETVHVEVRVGTFTVGIDQNLLGEKEHERKLSHMMAHGFAQGNLNLLSFCEVGGHRQGLEAVPICPGALIDGVLPGGEYEAASLQAYMNIWDTAGATQPGGVSLQQARKPTVVELNCSGFQSELAIFEFFVTAQAHPGMIGCLLHGLLHIRIPHGNKVNDSIKRRLTKQALRKLENRAKSAALQPTVCVLTGDVNLNQQSAYTVVQPEVGQTNVEEHWHTQTARAALPGDVAFIKGTGSTDFPISIGCSYPGTGVWGNRHDFFGFELSVPLVKDPSLSSVPQRAAWETLVKEPDAELGTEATSSGDERSPKRRRRSGPCHALKHGVQDGLMEELYRWYEERLDAGTKRSAWRHLHQCLYRRVRVSGVLMLVSKEDVTRQVRGVIEWRERWLRMNNFPLDTLMDSTQKDEFLTESKDKFHTHPDQKRKQERDFQQGGKDLMKKRMKSRWDLFCQREGGSKPMWEVLSFSGRFDPNFFDNLEDPGPPPDEAIRDQRHWTSRASKARKRWRQGMNAASQSRAILTRKQQHLVELYENGELLEEANQLTLLSGNGTLRRKDGKC